MSTGVNPSLVVPAPEQNNATPSVQTYYGAFVPGTGCSAPMSRISNLFLAGSSRLNFSLRIGTPGSLVPCRSPAQTLGAFMPDAVWAELRTPPDSEVSDVPPVLASPSTRHQRFASARLPEAIGKGSRPLGGAAMTDVECQQRRRARALHASRAAPAPGGARKSPRPMPDLLALDAGAIAAKKIANGSPSSVRQCTL